MTAGLSFLPSFLPPDTEAWGSRRGVRMAGCAPIRHKDRRTDKEQTSRPEDAAAVDFGFDFIPIRSYKENYIIPVWIGQQEGGGVYG